MPVLNLTYAELTQVYTDRFAQLLGNTLIAEVFTPDALAALASAMVDTAAENVEEYTPYYDYETSLRDNLEVQVIETFDEDYADEIIEFMQFYFD